MFQGECRLKSGRVRVLLSYEFASDIEANYVFSLKTYVKHLIMYVRFVYIRLRRSMSQASKFYLKKRFCLHACVCACVHACMHSIINVVMIWNFEVILVL